jgi:ATP synthase protein I
MADADGRGDTERPEEHMRAEVARRAERRGRAARERSSSVWSSLGLLGVVGWSITIPALLGVALGRWIDGHWPSRASWTLTLLLLGVVLGGVNVWRWIQQQSRDD